MLKHLDCVLQATQVKNLTSITDRDAGKVLHLLDSLAVLPEVQKAPAGEMADLGSGAGFPGIPLALLSNRRTFLIEANKKKAGFLQGFVEQNELSRRIKVLPCRSEEIDETYAASFSVVTARAVAELPVLLELASPLLNTGGHFIALKGCPSVVEVERGNTVAKKVGLLPIARRTYTLGDLGAQRCVLVYCKERESFITLPRRPGMAAKKPLA